MKMINTALLTLLLTFSLCAEASVSFKAGYKQGTGTQSPEITIDGTITNKDVKTFEKILSIADENAKELGLVFEGETHGAVVVELNSLGGDVSSALAIGQHIRQFSAIVAVSEKSVCASSCVFLLAAGNRRVVMGKVGIHRPYMSVDEKMSVSAQKASYRNIESKVKAYLDAMNVPVHLYDRMIRIPPEKVHWLTESELQSYGLNENDPYFDEATTANMAQTFGVSKQDYLSVISEARELCPGPGVTVSAYATCFNQLIEKKKSK